MIRTPRNLLLVLALLVAVAAGQQTSSFKSPQDIGEFMQSYHLHPQPDRIPELIAALANSGALAMEGAQPGTIGFFSEGMAANPDRSAAWIELISKQDAQTKNILDQA